MNQPRLAFVLAFVVGVVGCQSQLNFSKSVELTPGDDFRFTVDGPKKDQTVIVEVSSSDVPINACICLKSDESAVVSSLGTDKVHESVLAKIEKTKQGTMEAKVPAGKETVVFLWGASKKTSAKVHIKGK